MKNNTINLLSSVITLLYFFCAQVSFGQLIKGSISNNQGEALPFAKVWLKNTSYGTIANGKGEYHLELKEQGEYEIRISTIGYESLDTIIPVNVDVVEFHVVLYESVQELEEVLITSESSRKKGKKIMKEVISRRKGFLEAANRYECQTYCFTSLDKRTEIKGDTIIDSSALNRSKMNITEWKGTSYFEAKNRYKDIITGFIDYTDKVNNKVGARISFGNDELGESSASIESNPYGNAV